MPGLNPTLVLHELKVSLSCKPIKQPRRKFSHKIKAQIEEEISKLLEAGYIKPIHHSTWLANTVPVEKKNEKIRCCVDFRDLNRACPKDDFPLPLTDLLVDSTDDHEVFSLMDRYSGYNHIRMRESDAPKTAFATPVGNLYYVAMPFGLKNTGARYQRAMTLIFHDINHREMEVYVYDIVVKAKKKADHVSNLRRVLSRCRSYGLKMNPAKCTFGITSVKILGFKVTKSGIKLDEDKANAILTMTTPRNKDELQALI